MSLNVQLIDEDKVFHLNNVQNYLNKSTHSAYNVVAVFGSQSTGKSTLLNALFHTNFEIMDERHRRQTTKGIWLSLSSINQSSSTIILDVEGSDGRERGEDQDFERKAALFALATSQILIINLWENQVGLYQGANMALLKTVFEVNALLFQSASAPAKSKSRIMFVIRDFLGVTPLEDLESTIMADMNRLWEGTSNNDSISDWFDFQFIGLPHKLLKPEEFNIAISDLSLKFSDNSLPDYVFSQEYSRNVPLDGWPIYASNIWEQIIQNKDLDLPTQQHLVAQFRCDEIANDAQQLFSSALPPPPYDIAHAESMCSSLHSAYSSALAHYDNYASRYPDDVYNLKKNELTALMSEHTSSIIAQYLDAVRSAVEDAFRSELSSASDTESFTQTVASAAASAKASYTEYIQSADPSEYNVQSTTLKESLDTLNADIEDIITEHRRKLIVQVTEKTVVETVKPMQSKVSGLIQNLSGFSKRTPQPATDREQKDDLEVEPAVGEAMQLWDTAVTDTKTLLFSAQGQLDAKLEVLNATEEEKQESTTALEFDIWNEFLKIVGKYASSESILIKAREVYEDSFKYNTEGMPNIFSDDNLWSDEKIQELYRSSKKTALSVIDSISKSPDIKLPSAPLTNLGIFSEIAPKKAAVVKPFTSDQLDEIKHQLIKVADSTYIDARQAYTNASKAREATELANKAAIAAAKASEARAKSLANVPLYLYLLLLFFGWNELLAFFRLLFSSPFTLMFIILIGSTLVVIWSLGLWNHFMFVARQSFKSLKATIKSHLASIVVETDNKPETIEMQNLYPEPKEKTVESEAKSDLVDEEIRK
ncbi:hypothetical protein CANCADRAFT_44870 [Tortispora caseinolytica NRRL Y-17796]|uniref:GB1/RHD3-type G domain-containing protein n=1 Tax=Tortispora caseinolytica NRRL Y-17796 TaxID=767744 RepID=A0A1E4THN7_9ASCO|nr:hypothetical protein CANCADRAFT_44870 [Tortispora caseinolytica NRRL Y-17796]